jgi:hypothetical protein
VCVTPPDIKSAFKSASVCHHPAGIISHKSSSSGDSYVRALRSPPNLRQPFPAGLPEVRKSRSTAIRDSAVKRKRLREADKENELGLEALVSAVAAFGYQSDKAEL